MELRTLIISAPERDVGNSPSGAEDEYDEESPLESPVPLHLSFLSFFFSLYSIFSASLSYV